MIRYIYIYLLFNLFFFLIHIAECNFENVRRLKRKRLDIKDDLMRFAGTNDLRITGRV